MSTIDARNNTQVGPNFAGLAKPQKSQESPQSGGPARGDGSVISGEAKKPEPTGERKDLLEGLKSNFGGNDRIQTKQSKLEELSTDQLRSVQKKREFDKALTKHEEDHHSVAADLARSQPLYETEVGEDGAEYRKSGKVMIDTGITDDDDKTVKKMRQVRAAALAPDGNQLAPLSDADKKIAAEATEKEQAAQARLSGSSKEGPKEEDKKGGGSF
ncbi:MAG: putative metalloprotease CJM1_0395 family protein [Vulcanimicrobiota bacterium]